jgi:hypothetical protein
MFSETGAYFLKGKEDERAFAYTGRGESEAGVVESSFAEEEYIDIDDAGGVADGVWLAPEFSFKCLGEI